MEIRKYEEPVSAAWRRGCEYGSGSGWAGSCPDPAVVVVVIDADCSETLCSLHALRVVQEISQVVIAAEEGRARC